MVLEADGLIAPSNRKCLWGGSLCCQRHHDSHASDLARLLVIEAQGAMAEKLFAKNIDLIGQSSFFRVLLPSLY